MSWLTFILVIIGVVAVSLIAGAWIVLAVLSAFMDAASDTKPKPKPQGPIAFKI